MFDLLRRHIEKRTHLSPEEFARCTDFFTRRTVRKRQFLLQAGEVCRHLAFVGTGCLRVYTVDGRGDEHILQFAIADWWASDLQSFLSGLPAISSIDALQDSDVLLLEKTARDRLFEAVPPMERFFRLLAESNYIATHRRINATLSQSAEQRYLAFLATYPAFVEQIPQNQIASYLGITPQSLSRIRKDLAQRDRER